MIKVIEHGYQKYYESCYRCGCRFEYELEDISDGYVKCPDCGTNSLHNHTLNVNLSSQIEDCTEDKNENDNV